MHLTKFLNRKKAFMSLNNCLSHPKSAFQHLTKPALGSIERSFEWYAALEYSWSTSIVAERRFIAKTVDFAYVPKNFSDFLFRFIRSKIKLIRIVNNIPIITPTSASIFILSLKSAISRKSSKNELKPGDVYDLQYWPETQQLIINLTYRSDSPGMKSLVYKYAL